MKRQRQKKAKGQREAGREIKRNRQRKTDRYRERGREKNREIEGGVG